MNGFRNRVMIKRSINCAGRKLHSSNAAPYQDFLENVAKVKAPTKLPNLLQILQMQNYELIAPTNRAGVNPLLIPLARDPSDKSLLGYLRWPTQKEDMSLQLVKTNEVGLSLLSLDTDSYCHRQAIELDVAGDARAADVLELADLPDNKKYLSGSALGFINTAKLPKTTETNRMRVNLDRYLLLKVGPFLDSYRRLAYDYHALANDVNALVTCERAVNVFYGWGSPTVLHMQLLLKSGRTDEARDAAKSALSNPKFVLCDTKQELEEIVNTAGYTGISVLGEMHAFRAKDDRKKEMEEGLTREQVLLDQAAHLMDAVTLGAVKGGWDGVRGDIASRYRDGGYPDIAKFIETTTN